ncbi:hypothetical protein Aperf_G00000036242 [Anoplocephala perfoliata]
MSVKSGRPPPRPMDSAIGSPHTPTAADMGLGLQAIYRACYRLYPDQPSPLQVTALRKFWMGGPDPLDYIYMFANPGSPEARSPPHWHYVTNGLSDLYGDARLHNCSTSADGPSGFGFELTFRLRREPGEKSPPTWPAHLLQSLARYVFRSQAQFLPGDHIPWHCPLDQLPSTSTSANGTPGGSAAQPPKNSSSSTTLQQQQQQQQQQSVAMAAVAAAASLIAAQASNQGGEPIDPSTYSSALAAAVSAAQAEYTKRTQSKQQQKASAQKNTLEASRIRHMLLVDDPQLAKINTPYGWVRFLQIVGLCDEELHLVQRWTGGQVADILRQQGATGGGLLVTDLRREQSIFELEPGLADYINERMHREGSNLSGVTTQFFAWAAIDPLQLTELLPGESEASAVAATGPQHNRAVAMETEDSGSVTTLHKAPSSVTTHIPSSNKTDDDGIADIVGDDSVCSSDAPKAKTAKNEETSATATDSCDSEMRVVDSEGQQQQQQQPQQEMSTTKEHGTSGNGGKKEGTSAFRNGTNAPNSSASPLDLLTEMRLRRTGGSSSAGGFQGAPYGSGGGSSSLPGTPGSSVGGGGDSAPCTPLAHLSLSPASLEMHPSRAIDCLDVHLSLEAGKLLPLAICDRLKHGRHFTFLNANYPEHAITLVPPGVTGAMVTPEVPFVSRGFWLQIFLPKDFLEQLERQFSILQYPEEVVLPLVFRWPERRFRICILDASNAQPLPPSLPPPVPPAHPMMPPRSMPGSAPTFTPTSPIPPNLFPPGCVPPPQVLAAFINAQQGRGGGGFMGSASPQGSGASSSQSPPFMSPFPIGKLSPASTPHLAFTPSIMAPVSNASPTSPTLMEAMLASLMSLYGGGGGVPFAPPFSVHQYQSAPPSDPSNVRPPW